MKILQRLSRWLYPDDGIRADAYIASFAIFQRRLKAYDELQNRNEWLRAQLMNTRAAQTTFRDRLGWEVSAYIPEAVVKELRSQSTDYQARFITNVAWGLVKGAMDGILHIDSLGKVNALLSEPQNINGPVRASRWISAVFEKDGKLSVPAQKATVQLQELGAAGIDAIRRNKPVDEKSENRQRPG